ncbi:MAG: Protein phosphatase methylesterase 1 [Lichina confinis]|nr:MAG: Protein phosphatase methylesterase 1 [Lichina confinis]
MSKLQKLFMKAELSRASEMPPPPPPPPPLLENAAVEKPGRLHVQESLPSVGESDDSSSVSSESSTATIRPLPAKDLFARPQRPAAFRKSSSALGPLPWSSFFSQELYLNRPSSEGRVVYHAYFTPPSTSGPLFVTHHGAGSTALSFAALAAAIKERLPAAGMLSPDARGHGDTVVEGANDGSALDLSLATLSRDAIEVVQSVREKLGWSQLPPVILVGHSLGGAVVAEVAKSRALGDQLLGHVVLDVVEGSAMDALQSMQTYLSTRPSTFPSLSKAIEWHVRSRTIRNSSSARISVPALVQEHRESGNDASRWGWRTDLASTQPFWEGWFDGLSKKFLEARGGKLLLLAGTDRLDKELMIGQMQGKYQLAVIPEAGHFIHEDAPDKTANILVEFYKRNDRSTLVLPPKVSDLLKAKQDPNSY